MSSNHNIRMAVLPFLLIGFELLAQSQSPTLPNAPGAQSLILLSAQSKSTAMPSPPPAADGAPTLLTRQEAEKIALANNPRIQIRAAHPFQS